MGFDATAEELGIMQFKSIEDGTEYDVWRIDVRGSRYVLKLAKENEMAVFKGFLTNIECGAPRLCGTAQYEDADYILMEYAEGTELCKCDRKSLKLTLDALIAIQDAYWEKREYAELGFCMEKSLVGRRRRMEYLPDKQIADAYAVYLKLYESLPRTLCHDDLLPFNVLVTDEKATLIDWEVAGLLPYPSSLARLIAHGEEDANALFYMTDEDKAYAIEYYYEHLIKQKGIAYGDYRRAMDYFLLYEYCEWVYLGERYGEKSSERYQRYLALAKSWCGQITHKLYEAEAVIV